MGCRVLGDVDSPVIPTMLYIPHAISGFSRQVHLGEYLGDAYAHTARDLRIHISRQALARSLAVVVVGYPATPVLLGRARCCVSASHTDDQLEEVMASRSSQSVARSPYRGA